MWQDVVLSTVGFGFTVMLIPQLMDVWRGKIVDGVLTKAILNFWTCLVTGVGCIIVGVVDITLNLPIAAIVSVFTGIMWLSLMYYSEKNRRKKSAHVSADMFATCSSAQVDTVRAPGCGKR